MEVKCLISSQSYSTLPCPLYLFQLLVGGAAFQRLQLLILPTTKRYEEEDVDVDKYYT